MMRVMHLVNKFVYGGAELVAFTGHCLLQQSQIESFIVSVRKGDPTDALVRDFGVENWFSMDVARYRVCSFPKIVAEAYKISCIVRRRGINIIHSHCEIPDFVAIMLRLILMFSGVRFVRTVHNERFMGLKQGPVVENLLSTLFDMNICISERTLENIRWGNKRILYNPIRVSEGPFERRDENLQGEIRVGVVGRLSVQKNQIELLKYLQSPTYRRKGIRYIFYGFDPGAISSEAKAQLQGLAEFKGFERDVQKIYDQLAVLFIPSLFEGLSSVMVEALVRGVPVFSFDVSGVADVNKLLSYSMLVSGFDHFETRVSQGIPFLAPSQINALQEMFSPLSYGKSLCNLYEELLDVS